MADIPLYIPVILGTPRQGRQSEFVAKFIVEQISTRADIETELIDIRRLAIATDDAGKSIKNSQFSAAMERADGLIIVVPEDAIDTVLQVSQSTETGKVEAAL